MTDDDQFEQQADFCSILCNPNRLKLFHLLSQEEYAVSELAAETGIPQATISQHLRKMRDKNTVRRRTEGNKVYYQLRDDRLIDALETIRNILQEQSGEEPDFSWMDK